MVNLKTSVALLLCLLHLPTFTSAFFKNKRLSFGKRFVDIPRSRVSKRSGISNKPYFKGEGFPEVTIGTKHGSLVLECVCGGPTPTIHWLKNGIRLQQGETHNSRDDEASYENHPATQERRLRLATTNSKLFLDCLNEEEHNAVYTCVAETPYYRITRMTRVKVVKPDYDIYSEVNTCFGKRSGKAEPARVYMWTSARLEYESGKVQLYCRAQGTPAPTITWYDVNNKPVQDDDTYKIARNGDLIINRISWFENMGTYTCEADNGFGTDSARAFLYPTRRD